MKNGKRGDIVRSGKCGENLTWLLNGGVFTVSGVGRMKDYSYREELAPWCRESWGDGIISVIIEDGVTSIGDWAFFGCDGVLRVSLPETLTEIGPCAFAKCRNLTSVQLPKSLTSIGKRAFWECMSLASVELPDGLEVICERAFEGCANLESIRIPSSLVTIEKYAFMDCERLTSIEIPKSVAEIGENAFVGCANLTDIIVDAENPNYCSVYGVLYSKDMTKLIAYPQGKTDTSFVVPDGVEVIEGAFAGNKSLESVEIGRGVVLRIGRGVVLRVR